MYQHTTTITRMFLHLFLNCSPFYRLRFSLVRGFYGRRDTFRVIVVVYWDIKKLLVALIKASTLILQTLPIWVQQRINYWWLS